MRIGPLWAGTRILAQSGSLYFLSCVGQTAPNRQINHLRRATMATKSKSTKSKTTKSAKPAAKPAAPAVEDGRLKSGRLSSKGMSCLCGCGEDTATDGARFRTGHDARLKGTLGRILAGNKRDGDAISTEVRPFLQEDGGIVGYTAQFKGNQVKLAKIAKAA